MAEIVSSAVAQEAVSQVLSSIKNMYEAGAKEHVVERMEIAHIKLEAALETSEKWNITSVPLLRWRKKLKRVARKCDDTLRSWKQHLQEDEELEHRVRTYTFPLRIFHSARSLVSSIFNHGDEEPNESTVRRFEWFADGASEFLRYMELSGTPCRYMFFDPLVRHLLEGKGTEYYFVRGDQQLSFLLQPFSLPGYGIEGRLVLILQDGNSLENNFILGLHLRLTESTDIVGVIVRCMQLFTPHFRSMAETARTELTQLPTQDFYWTPYYFSTSSRKEQWDDHHTIICKWFRQNPLCCHQHHHHYAQSNSGRSMGSLTESLSCDTYLEPVTEVYLHAYVAFSPTSYKRQRITNAQTQPTRDSPYLKLSALFSPHASSEDLSPAVEGSATQMINGETINCALYENISFEQLGDIMLPNAVDCLHGSTTATSYQMLWKSKHGGAYFGVEEMSWRATNRNGRGGKRQTLWGEKAQGWTREIVEFIDSWATYAPAQLQDSINDWVQKNKVDATIGGRDGTPTK